MTSSGSAPRNRGRRKDEFQRQISTVGLASLIPLFSAMYWQIEVLQDALDKMNTQHRQETREFYDLYRVLHRRTGDLERALEILEEQKAEVVHE